MVDTADDGRRSKPPIEGGALRMARRSTCLLSVASRVIRKSGALHRLGATYRLQLGPELTFARAKEVAT